MPLENLLSAVRIVLGHVDLQQRFLAAEDGDGSSDKCVVNVIAALLKRQQDEKSPERLQALAAPFFDRWDAQSLLFPKYAAF